VLKTFGRPAAEFAKLLETLKPTEDFPQLPKTFGRPSEEHLGTFQKPSADLLGTCWRPA